MRSRAVCTHTLCCSLLHCLSNRRIQLQVAHVKSAHYLTRHTHSIETTHCFIFSRASALCPMSSNMSSAFLPAIRATECAHAARHKGIYRPGQGRPLRRRDDLLDTESHRTPSGLLRTRVGTALIANVSHTISGVAYDNPAILSRGMLADFSFFHERPSLTLHAYSMTDKSPRSCKRQEPQFSVRRSPFDALSS
jgi:hypothetical protein